jgi:hypothetical protein
MVAVAINAKTAPAAGATERARELEPGVVTALSIYTT